MTKKSLWFKSVSLFLAVCCIATTLIFAAPRVSADDPKNDKELQDLQRQYQDIEKEIEKNKKQLAGVQSDIKDTKTKLNTINGEIDGINAQIGILDSRINVLNSNINTIESTITKTSSDIETLNATIAETENQMNLTRELMGDTKDMLLGRIRENYMSGEASTIEVLFSSEDISSFFTRKELMARVSEKDAQLIQTLTGNLKELEGLQESLNGQVIELEDKNVQLETQKTALGEQQEDLQDSKSVQQDKKKEVTAKKQEVQVILSELNEDSAEYKAEIKRQEAEKEQLSRQIDEYIRQHGSSTGDVPDAAYENDGKMAWPVKFQSYITAGYPAYSNGSAHWGIDIVATGGNTRGRPFCAAQGGKVILAVNDGNWNYGFGNYCVIDHGDGTQTLYAHSDNLQCYVGQIVKKGQQIGIIGATGNVTGPHLHFEVRVKNANGSVSRVQPLNYVHNPY